MIHAVSTSALDAEIYRFCDGCDEPFGENSLDENNRCPQCGPVSFEPEAGWGAIAVIAIGAAVILGMYVWLALAMKGRV